MSIEFYDLVFSCPYCNFYTKGLPKTDLKKAWTDRDINYPFTDNWYPLVKCKKCSKLYWLDEAKTDKKLNFNSACSIFNFLIIVCLALVYTTWTRSITIRNYTLVINFILVVCYLVWFHRYYLHYSHVPSIKEIYNALSEKMWSDKEQELSLRLLAWRMENDKYRLIENKTSFESFQRSCAEKENMKILFGLLGFSVEELILKAELARELGDFELANKQLIEAKTPLESQKKINTSRYELNQIWLKTVRYYVEKQDVIVREISKEVNTK